MKIGIIGAGTWGTALGQLLAAGGDNVNLWARRSDVVEGINQSHRNPRHLSDVALSENIVATVAYEDCLRNAAALVVATPSRLMRGVARALSVVADPDLRVVVCTQGAEEGTGLVATRVFEQEMGNSARLAALSGPSQAEELVRGLPTGAVVASESPSTARFFQQAFTQRGFQVSTSHDVIGVQICGVMANVAAIAVGLSYGMGYGDGAAALLITRAQKEMGRLASAFGADPATCTGVAGTGCLTGTCFSDFSVDRQLGFALAHGETLESFRERSTAVSEGALACRLLPELGARLRVRMPLAEAVRSVIWDGSDARATTRHLVARAMDRDYGW